MLYKTLQWRCSIWRRKLEWSRRIFKESTSAQHEVTQSAKEVAETIETMTKLVNSQSDDMQAQWLSFTDTAKMHSSRAVSAINKINLKNITTRLPLELVSLGRPMILFLIISA